MPPPLSRHKADAVPFTSFSIFAAVSPIASSSDWVVIEVAGSPFKTIGSGISLISEILLK